jgi:hypothetical protein
MTASKIAITLDDKMLKQIDILVKSKYFPNRSKAIQEAVAEKLVRLEKSRCDFFPIRDAWENIGSENMVSCLDL